MSCGDFSRTIGIAAPWADSESCDPLVFIEVKDRSVATSGSSQRGFRIGGQWYSHVFDPRTGEPVERVASATVVAPQGGRRRRPREGLLRARARAEPATDPFAAGNRVPDRRWRAEKLTKSNGWPLLESPQPVALAAADEPKPKTKPAADAPKEKDAKKADKKPRPPVPWNKELELVVNFEINHPGGADGGDGGGAEAGRRGEGDTAGLTWPSGSRTPTAIPCGRCRSGSRRAAPGRFNGSPT